MFQRLREEVSNAVENRARIGIFCPRKSWVEMLAKALLDSGIPEEEIGKTVLLLNPDTVRNIPPCRRLLFTGFQRPQYAGFYLHPRTDETVILSYDGRWAEQIQRHANDYVERMNAVVSGTDEYPIPSPTVEADIDSGDSDARNRPDGTKASPHTSDLLEGSDVSDISKSDSVGEPEGTAQEGDEGESGERLNRDRDRQVQRRILDIVNLSPTTNGELMKEWNLDSGLEVYQYLSSNLDDFYTRNDDKLIVPTEEGRRIAEIIGDEK